MIFASKIRKLRLLAYFAPLAIGLLLASCTPDARAEEFTATAPPPSATLEITPSNTPTATHTLQPSSTASPSPSATRTLNCTYTSSYWQNRPDEWLTSNIIIGRLNYTKEEALELFAAQDPDVTTRVLQQFISAALNILKGADPSAVDFEISFASSWLNDHLPASGELLEADREQGIALADTLGAYNNGVIGPGLCPDQPSTPTPTPTATLTPTETRPPYQPPSRQATSTPRPQDDDDDDPPPPPPPTATKPPPPTNTQAPPPTDPPPPTDTPRPLPTEAPPPTQPPSTEVARPPTGVPPGKRTPTPISYRVFIWPVA